MYTLYLYNQGKWYIVLDHYSLSSCLSEVNLLTKQGRDCKIYFKQTPIMEFRGINGY